MNNKNTAKMVRKNNDVLMRRHRERLRYICRKIEDNIPSRILRTRLKQDTRLPEGGDFLKLGYLDNSSSNKYWAKYIIISEKNSDDLEYTVKMEYIDNTGSNKNVVKREFVNIHELDTDIVMNFIDNNLGPIKF